MKKIRVFISLFLAFLVLVFVILFYPEKEVSSESMFVADGWDFKFVEKTDAKVVAIDDVVTYFERHFEAAGNQATVGIFRMKGLFFWNGEGSEWMAEYENGVLRKIVFLSSISVTSRIKLGGEN